MTFHHNHEYIQCKTCGKRVQKPNFNRHFESCSGLSKNELSTISWETAADLILKNLPPELDPKNKAIRRHLESVVVTFLKRQASRVKSRRRS